MPDKKIIQVDQAMFETELDRMVSRKVEEILDAMLDADAERVAGAGRYERSDGRKAYLAGHYERRLTVKAGGMTVRVPRLKGALFESAVIQRHRTRESSVEEALMEMYFSGVSTRQVDAVGERLWGDRMPPQTLSDDLKRIYKDIDEWRNRPLERTFPYVFMDGIWPKRSWGGSIENVSVLVAIGVGDDGRREVIGVDEGMKEDTASWESFIRGLVARRLTGVRLAIGDRNPGLLHAVGELLPGARHPAVHGPLRTQRARQDAPPEAQARRRQAQGRVRHGGPRKDPGQGRIGGRRTRFHETEGGGVLPARGHRRGDGLPAAGIPHGALAAGPHQQHGRTARPRDTPQDKGRRPVPRRQERPHARHPENPPRHPKLARTPPPGHVPTRTHNRTNGRKPARRRSRLKTESAQQTGRYLLFKITN